MKRIPFWKTIEILKTVETIGERSFYKLTKLTKLTTVNIYSSVQVIDNYAFHGSTKLHTINFRPNLKLKTLGINLFDNCSSLNKIIILNSVKSIGQDSFKNIISLLGKNV